MEQRFNLAYGDGNVPLTVRAAEIAVLEASTPPPIHDWAEAFRAAVEEQAIDSPPLAEALGPDDAVTVVISDLTRAWMHQERLCPLLLDYLHDRIGIPDERIVFLVALGTHRPMAAAELRKLVSPAVAARVRIVNHEADKPLCRLGVTTRGTEVCVNPLVTGRKVILIGGTVHHLLAGYGGGRKSILPGVSGENTIRQNHLLALHPTEPRSNEAVGCGMLAGNPVHEDMLEAAAMVGPVFGINVVVDAAGELLALPSGHYVHAWEQSCRLVDRYNGVPIEGRYDAVIASCGGFPRDINLYQSSKTLINAFQAVRPGGKLFFFSECREGGGPAAFFDWSRYQRDGSLDAQMRRHFTIAGYIFYVCCEIAAQTECHILSAIPADTLAPMRIHGHASAAELAPLLDFGAGRVAVLPHGGSTVPMCKKSAPGG